MKQPQPAQPAYILHARPYRDSSLILELLTSDFGRIGCVARGARRDKRRRQQALQPFSPLLVSLLGNGALKTLGSVENVAAPLWLKGRAVYVGLYANELLVRLLPEGEAHYALFAMYQVLLEVLAQSKGDDSNQLEGPLRRFELQLLRELGSCPPLDYCTGSQGIVSEGVRYQLEIEQGFVPVYRQGSNAQRDNEFSGEELLGIVQALESGKWSAGLLLPAKRLTRILLQAMLGGRPLQSRALFRQVYGK
ncbi:DNA repair protein RecO [Microbulbifer spongiae]|uniref:DNA repair protein RecO n=1 Tax=Microbulbifer spongiae TaxID=2944933 RepID=A0ABY9ED54_9GAMM|nr:DNA repair protein RecO [Microbulbifer sp. MI-G]WKD50910.1 DNA repair protein RecO [Microbulbifer sp. MI-G]